MGAIKRAANLDLLALPQPPAPPVGRGVATPEMCVMTCIQGGFQIRKAMLAGHAGNPKSDRLHGNAFPIGFQVARSLHRVPGYGVKQNNALDTVSDYALRLGAVSFFRKENHLGAMKSAIIDCLVFKVN